MPTLKLFPFVSTLWQHRLRFRGDGYRGNFPTGRLRRISQRRKTADYLDPAFAPGTGTPEPGGLSTNQVLTMLEEWADLPFVGMDCVEVAPPFDHAELSSHAAATFVWTYLCGQLVQHLQRP